MDVRREADFTMIRATANSLDQGKPVFRF